jgi:Fanconi anemia group D2 protein
MSLAKRHDREGALHAVALKGTAAFVASLLRSMPFWKGCVSACPVEGVAWFERVARLSQKGTRLAQAVIADGKARGDARLAAAAPSARKVMEALVVAATALVARAAGDAGASFGVGNLKHRDVQGRVVSSQQAYESSEEEESSSSEEEDSDSDSDSEGEAEVDEDKKKKASSSAAAAAAANKNKKKASKKARRDAPAPASAAAADDAGSGGEEEEEEEEETAEEDNGEEEEAEEEGDE